MDEVRLTAKSFWLYAFTGFISVNLLFIKQGLNVDSISANNAVMPLIICFMISLLQRLLILLNTKENLIRSLNMRYHIACSMFFTTCVMSLYFLAAVLDKSDSVSKALADHRRKEKGGLAKEDEFDDLEDQMKQELNQLKMWFFGMLYAVCLTFTMVYLCFSKIEEQHLILIDDPSIHEAKGKHAKAIISLHFYNFLCLN